MSRTIRADQLREGMQVSAISIIHPDYAQLWRHQAPTVVDIAWEGDGGLPLRLTLSDDLDRPFYLDQDSRVTVEETS